jgi:hypothetical protein
MDGAVQQARPRHLRADFVTVTPSARRPVPSPREIRRSLVPYAGMVAAIVLAGLASGAVWAAIAPPARASSPVTNPPTFLPESDFHRFDDLAVFLLISLVAGLLTGAAVWLWRSARGPLIVLAAVLGALLGGLVAIAAGPAVAATLYPSPAHAAAGKITTLAPVLEFTARRGAVHIAQWIGVLAAQPFGLVLAYLTLAVWNGTPGLGRDETEVG